jgi:hypothetical protein
MWLNARAEAMIRRGVGDANGSLLATAAILIIRFGCVVPYTAFRAADRMPPAPGQDSILRAVVLWMINCFELRSGSLMAAGSFGVVVDGDEPAHRAPLLSRSRRAVGQRVATDPEQHG